MKNIGIKIISVLLFVSMNSGFIQSEEYSTKTERVSDKLGVSVNLVYRMYQDSKGFMWFGTMFGLIRYDGVNYITYRHDPSDTNSLSNDDIISFLEDREGYLWFGTYNGGLNRYDRNTGVFTRYIHDNKNPGSVSGNVIWSMVQDKEGTIWIATEDGGLCRFDNGIFKTYKHDPSNVKSISSDQVRTLSVDNQGNIWAGTSGSGLNVFDKSTEEFKVYKSDKENKSSISGNFIHSMICDSYGDIWIGTGAAGLNKFEKNTGTFIRYLHDKTDSGSISDNSVLSITEEYPGVLAVGTGNGLNRFSVRDGKFSKINITDDPVRKREVIMSICKDKSGVLWVSNYQEGLYKLSQSKDIFKNYLENYNVLSLHQDHVGNYWIGTQNGLYRSDTNFKILESYFHDPNNSGSISSNYVRSIAKDSYGDIWIGTNNGLNKFDISKNSFVKFFNEPDNANSLSANNINNLYTDRSGILWIGTPFGVNEYIPSENKFKRYLHSDSIKESLSENTILSIYEDRSASMWFGTFAGLNKLNRVSGNFIHYRHDPSNVNSLSNNYVYSFCEDEAGNFWIGTGGGLNKFNPSSGTFTYFNEKNGLENSVIAGIISDRFGNLWLSTMKGLSRFSPNQKEVRNFDVTDGLSNNMFNFSSGMASSDGEIFFGGVNGLCSVNPAEVKNSGYIPDIIFTGLTRYNDNIKFTDYISSENEISLSHKDAVINIGFSSSDFSAPDKILFSYLLEGFDFDWTPYSSLRNAVYTNLDPGNYTFKVKGTNADGVINESVAEIKISISPPYWKTWWFYTIVFSVLIASLILIHNLRVRRKVKHLLDIEKARESEREKVREQASRDYHDELGHKLTRISLYSRRVNKKLQALSTGISDDLKFIVDTSNSLQSGAKDLIWTMNPQEDSLYDFAVRLKDFGNELFDNSGIEFHSGSLNTELQNIKLSMNCKRHLIYIFKEGMNNILKYSECKNVNLIFRIYDEDVEIILEDDGKGFDPALCQKGYGLKNIFSRAEQIDLNVNISSFPGAGTRITLTAGIQNLISVNSGSKL
ncbi:MAG: hypothetical protein IPM96_01805 [Ignavibacteria bacterium]|nr:hypothetical protein [Ignavibacteria bacterium]